MASFDESDFANPPDDGSSAALSETTPTGPTTARAPATAALTDAQGRPLPESSMGSGLLARQPTPAADEAVAVAKVCPQCGAEYETGDRFCPKDGSPLRPKAGGDPLIGRVIADRYLVMARLGEGGMGRVYLAEHVKMNRQCAIKVMNPSLVNDAESSQRFAREASNAARILHPNVAAVFDYGESDKIVYLVMEYVDGESLSTIVAREGALDPRRAIDLARQIADGLHAAHDLGIVHRDLKPDNVIVARTRAGKEVPKVVDFGIAKAVSEAPQDALTRSGLVIGTPEYMSPEQLLGDPVDARADIYSLGCILYQMLTGAPAFAAESREQMIRRRLHESPPHVRDLLPDLPRRLDTLIVHMLARSPRDRLASAAEARDTLDPALALGGWDPHAISGERPSLADQLTPRSAPTVMSSAAELSMQPTQPMARQRPAAIRVAAGVAAGLIVAVGGALLWLNREAPPVARGKPAVAAAADTSAPKPKPQTSRAETTSLATSAPRTPARPARAESSALRPPPAKTESGAATVSSVTDSLKIAVNPFIKAVMSGDTGAISRAMPGLWKQQRGFYQNVFQTGEHIRASSRGFRSAKVKGDSARAAFTLTLRYNLKSSKLPMSAPMQYSGIFGRKNGTWQLKELQPPHG